MKEGVTEAWYLYIIRTRLNSLYTGITTNVNRRLEEHREGASKGSKYLRKKGPLKLAYQTRIGSLTSALKAEQHIKRLPKQKKELILSQKMGAEALFTYLGLQWP